MLRKNYNTRLRKIARNISIAFASLALLNLATYGLSISFSVANPVGFLLSVYTAANTVAMGVAALAIGKFKG
jgi:hypothetical protein